MSWILWTILGIFAFNLLFFGALYIVHRNDK